MTDRATLGTALVLEDEPIIAFALEDMLLEIGFRQVLVATDIRDAVRMLESSLPSSAVLDVNIRGERSYSIAFLLAERGVPFIFATGYGDAQHPDELRSIPTVTKPYTAESIRAALAQA